MQQPETTSTSKTPQGPLSGAQMYLVEPKQNQETMTASTSANTPETVSDTGSETATLAPRTSSEGRDKDSNGKGDIQEPKDAAVDRKPGGLLRRHMTEQDVGELTRQLSRHLSRSNTSLVNPESDNFQLEAFLKQIFREADQHGIEDRETNVVFENLSVEGVGSGVTFGETVGSVLATPFTLLRDFSNFRHKPIKHILQDFTGTVEPGEMLLVLGRPGAGCSTFLKTLANNTKSFTKIQGDISYSGISPGEMIKRYAGDIVYLPEDDVHLPVLTVDQTLTFATASRAPAAQQRLGSREEYVKTLKAVQLAIFGLRHTVNTKVGNDYVRGISGGQRKRVSIAEAFVARAKVTCHDNSTRVSRPFDLWQVRQHS